MLQNSFGKNIKHVVFDLDGVLINSINNMQKSWEAVVDKFCLDIPFSLFREQIGRPFNEALINLSISNLNFEEIEFEYNRVSVKYQGLITVYEGVINLLSRLNSSKIEISIVTSKPINRTLSIVEDKFNGIEFRSVIAPEMVNSGRGKPCPDQLLLSFVKSGVSQANTIYIGDTELDRVSAKEANCRFLFAEWGYGVSSTYGDFALKSINDLESFIFNEY
jgi:phosphoglycolate phosphatase-like HAD superfamily hydrolase